MSGVRSLAETAATVRWIGGHEMRNAHGSPRTGSSFVMSAIGSTADGFEPRDFTLFAYARVPRVSST